MMIRHSFNPAVSIVLIPIDDDHAPELFLDTSENYSMGKLFRTGLDAVHGRRVDSDTGNMKKIYDSGEARKDLKKIEEHLKSFQEYFQDNCPRKTEIVLQGNGNLGLNNWSVGYINVECKTNLHKLILPTGEPIFERIYPSLVKTICGNKPHYEIAEVVYFYDLGENEDIKTYSLKEVEDKTYENPDREMKDNYVFLPVWNESLKTLFTTGEPVHWIDWCEDTQFFELPRDPEKGTVVVDPKRLKIVALDFKEQQTNTSKEYKIREIPYDIEFSFFGIPVQTLATKEFTDSKSNSSNPHSFLAEIVHYFYDLRHIFDLGQISQKEFYLLENVLKEKNFSKARDLLENKSLIEVYVQHLLELMVKERADTCVIGTLLSYVTYHDDLRNLLESKGYSYKANCDDVKEWGDFYFEKTPDGELDIIKVLPLRNVYPYSFCGIINTTDQKYLLLAVTSGAGGVRAGSVKNSRNVFSAPLKAGFSLEEAVKAITDQLTREFARRDVEFSWGDDSKLLLLDQGGDVHQWLGAGGLKTVVGSSEGRKLISSELIVAIDETKSPDVQLLALGSIPKGHCH